MDCKNQPSRAYIVGYGLTFNVWGSCGLLCHKHCRVRQILQQCQGRQIIICWDVWILVFGSTSIYMATNVVCAYVQEEHYGVPSRSIGNNEKQRRCEGLPFEDARRDTLSFTPSYASSFREGAQEGESNAPRMGEKTGARSEQQGRKRGGSPKSSSLVATVAVYSLFVVRDRNASFFFQKLFLPTTKIK